ncbi:lipopolysaccharide biosynthesis protein [Tumebacillus permanentifrigoris]|uniref:O-antigen/teichoic acid export membrane protein n=1 Tax=Tumebacillus permanentifrigoris TaxID=378543 RepID=A0A316D7X6_9BACL|nr:lipopolysaccharide biosynthesis protein [Tumebacillus permanentifrigoris]PWK09681.1 O-antigen/teichoic acid export membrane protein [Tumebacillus permanentifrigoris]
MLGRHTLFYLLARALPGAVNFIAIAFYTRLLSPGEYGQYTLLLSTAALLNVVCFQWLRVGLLRYLPMYEAERKDAFMGTVWTGCLLIMGITGAGLCVVGSLGWLPTGLPWGLVLGTLWIFACFDLFLEAARSGLSPIRYGILSISKSVLTVATGVGFAYFGLGGRGLVYGLMIGMVVPLAFFGQMIWRQVRPSLLDRAILRQLWQYGWPLTLTFSLGYLIYSSDRFLLGYFLGEEMTGTYAVSYDLTQQTLVLVMVVVNLASYPLIVRALEDKGIEEAAQRLKSAAVLLLTVSLPMTVVFISLATNISDVLFGASFRTVAAQIMPWIAISAFLQGFKSYYLDQAFQLGRKTSLQIWPVLGALVINLLLNVWWIPIWGVLGSAYAACCAYGFACLTSWALGRRVFPMHLPLREFAKTLLASGLLALMFALLSGWSGIVALVVQGVVGAVVYLGVVLVFNVGGVRQQVRAMRSRRTGERV